VHRLGLLILGGGGILCEGIDERPGPAAPDMQIGHYHSLLAHTADFIIDRYDADVMFVPFERRKQKPATATRGGLETRYDMIAIDINSGT
jgi:hypothetical protein